MGIKSICPHFQQYTIFAKNSYKMLSVALALILLVGLISGYTFGLQMGLEGALDAASILFIIASIKHYHKKNHPPPSSLRKLLRSPNTQSKKPIAKKAIDLPPKPSPNALTRASGSSPIEISSSSSSVSRTPPSFSLSSSSSESSISSTTSSIASTTSSMMQPASVAPLPSAPKSHLLILYVDKHGVSLQQIFKNVPHTNSIGTYVSLWQSKHSLSISSHDSVILINGEDFVATKKVGDLPEDSRRRKIIIFSISSFHVL